MTGADWAALGLFIVCWLGYGPILTVLARWSGSLNADMLVVRRAWMAAMTRRDVRIVDSQLLGHTINSGGFFASTNLLLIAAVASVLFGGQQALSGLAEIGAEASPAILEFKLALVLLCLVRGLLDFIWSIRQMNYALAIIGAAPDGVEGQGGRAAFAETAADVLNPALASFSQGVRAYYFALAAAAWVFGPLWLALGVASAFGLLVYRQAASPAARAIRRARNLVLRHDDPPPP